VTFTAELHHEAEVLVARRLGLRFGDDRRADVDRAFLEGYRSSRHPSPEAYLAWLAGLPDGSPEWGRIASRLTVGETYFFRDRDCFDALEQHLLPPLIAFRRSQGLLRLRLWSAGCATGEEPYSLAILLDRLLPDLTSWGLTVLATDINRDALDVAARGLYREWSFRETPPWVRDRYFRSGRGETFELDPRIRGMVTFAPLNLAEDGYPSLVTNTGAMDLILCRNVLMYFSPEAQREAVERLRHALVTGGWLVLSPVEASPELLRPLLPVHFPGSVFHRKEQPFAVPLPPKSWQAETLPPPALELPVSVQTLQGPSGPPAERPAEDRGDDGSLGAARALADQGKLESARRLCEAVLSRDRLDPEGYLLLAAICQELGDIPAALEGLRQAIYLAPDSAPAHFLLGALLFRGGTKRRGRRCLETACRLLESVPSEEPLDGAGGLTAGRLKEMARAYLAEA
jgi:chemotaxis protein methyltransferase CheR